MAWDDIAEAVYCFDCGIWTVNDKKSGCPVCQLKRDVQHLRSLVMPLGQ